MASNSFGTLFRITTWGESHGIAMGVVIDGCPAGLGITDEEIQEQLDLRAPGRNALTSPRQERDKAQILSGVFEGSTTGAPISIIVFNQDSDATKYEPIKDLLRPGHANFTYLEKYGVFDHRGGGRSSGRETLCRVAAGAIAKKLLSHYGIHLVAYLKGAGGILAKEPDLSDLLKLKARVLASEVFAPDEEATHRIAKKIDDVKQEGDSIGGLIELIASPLPTGLGDPIYEKLEANLAKAMLSIPASKGIEFGSGFHSAQMKGSENNDPFTQSPEGRITTTSNCAGGTLGGISSGMPLLLRIAFKPTSSILKTQQTVNLAGEPAEFTIPEGSRHDPCVAIRAVPVVEAMGALVLIDALLMNRCCRL